MTAEVKQPHSYIQTKLCAPLQISGSVYLEPDTLLNSQKRPVSPEQLFNQHQQRTANVSNCTPEAKKRTRWS